MNVALSISVLLLLAWLECGPCLRAQNYPAYHNISDKAAAQAEAQQRHLPLAWLGSYPWTLEDNAGGNQDSGTIPDMSQSSLPDMNSSSQPDMNQGNEANPPASPTQPVYFKLTSEEQREMTQSEISLLQGRAVVVFFDGTNMGPVPGIVHAQDHFADDGPIQGGAWEPPKVVFTDPAISHTLGRVAAKQVKNEGTAPLLRALAAIQQNPAALDPSPEPPDAGKPTARATPAAPPAATPALTIMSPIASATTPSTVPGTAPVGGARTDDDIDLSDDERTLSNFIRQFGVYVALGLVAVIIVAKGLSSKKT